MTREGCVSVYFDGFQFIVLSEARQHCTNTHTQLHTNIYTYIYTHRCICEIAKRQSLSKNT